MVLGFLFWLFFIGIVIASLQDLKRREVDNWLNLFLIFSSFTYLLFTYFVLNDFLYLLVSVGLVCLTSFLVFYSGDVFLAIENSKRKYYSWLFAFCLLFICFICFVVNYFGFGGIPFFMFIGLAFLVMFIVSNLFYEGRIFAGGDAKLLFAMTVFFIGVDFVSTLVNIGVFLFLLMISGSVYGLIYSLVLYCKDCAKVNREMKKMFSKLYIQCMILIGVVLIVLGFLNYIFLISGIILILLSVLYVFAKGLEGVFMVKIISGKDLREGDWLAEDVRIGKKLIKANWDGLSLEDIRLLKSKKKIKIKDGLPFVPAFLIAFLIYVFLKNYFLSLLFMGF